jgi:hypothetical protein
MLSFEWRELEVLCDRLSDLRHRHAAAHRAKHGGLVDGLKADIAKLRRQRELLVQHIAARLAAAAGERRYPPETADRRSPDRQDADPSHHTGVSVESAEHLPLL